MMSSLPLALLSRARAPLSRSTTLSVFRRYSSSPYAELTGFPKDSAPEITLESLSSSPFSQEIREKLSAPISTQDIEVKPDGQIYLPEIKYRRILNDALGAGAWVLVPRSPPVVTSKLVTREYSLYCFGKFVSQATGEQPLHGNAMSEATAIEATKSNALMRCCKDLGVASDLWDPNFILRWKAEHAQTVWCEHAKSKEKKLFTRKVGRPPFEYPWKETGLGPKAASLDFLDSDDSELDASPSSSPYSSYPSSSSSSSSSSSGGAVPAAAARAAAKRTGGTGVAFDPKGTVPPLLKKFAGMTWDQLFEAKNGLSYLEWVLKNFKTNDPDLFKTVEAALEHHRYLQTHSAED